MIAGDAAMLVAMLVLLALVLAFGGPWNNGPDNFA